MAGSPDDLFMLKTYFWLGSFQMAITEATGTMPMTEAGKQEQQFYLYRSYIGMGDAARVVSELGAREDLSPALHAVRAFAAWEIGGCREEDLGELRELLSANERDSGVCVVVGSALSRAGKAEEALKAVHHGSSLEELAIMVQVLLSMDRADVAAATVKDLRSRDEEAPLSQLSFAWLGIHEGGVALEDAVMTIRDLEDKYGTTPTLQNIRAVALMGQGRFEDAEKALMDALSSRPDHPDTLVNLIAVAQHRGKVDAVSDRFLADLRRVAPEHPFLAERDLRESAFDRIASEMGAGRVSAVE